MSGLLKTVGTLLAALLFSATAEAAVTNAPATITVNPTTGVASILDNSGTTVPLGTYNSTAHTFQFAVQAPSASILGGVLSSTAPTNNFMSGINTSGAPIYAQPGFSNLSGTASVTQMAPLLAAANTWSGAQTMTGMVINASGCTDLTAYSGGIDGNPSQVGVKPNVTCFGDKISTQTDIDILSVSGVLGTSGPFEKAQFGLNGHSRLGNNSNQEDLVKWNWVVNTGGGLDGSSNPYPATGFSNKVGWSMMVEQGPNGIGAYGSNYDIVNFSKYNPIYGNEIDATQFGAPLLGALVYETVASSSFPFQAWHLSNTANLATIPLTVSTTSGSTTLTVTGGNTQNLYNAERISCPALSISKARISYNPGGRSDQKIVPTGTTSLTISVPAPSTQTGVACTASTSAAQYLWLINGPGHASDSDISDNDDADHFLDVNGTHQVGISFGGTMGTAIAMQAGQNLSFNGLGGSLTYVGGYLQYYDGGVVYRERGVTNGVNFIVRSNAITGVAPLFYADGSDTNIDINFQAKGTGRLLHSSPISMASTYASVQDYYSAPTDNLAAMSPGGTWLSINPYGGHGVQYDNGSVAVGDSIRASSYARCKSHSGSAVEETCSISEMRSIDGYTPYWIANYSYSANQYIKGSDGSIFKAVGACTSKTTAPTMVGTSTPSPQTAAVGTAIPATQSDGASGCSWQYVGNGAGNNRSANLLTTSGSSLTGDLWGTSIVTSVDAGAWTFNSAPNGGFATAIEDDIGNNTHDCPPGVVNGCQVYGIFTNSNGTYKGTIGLSVGGTAGWHIGLQFGGTAAGSGTFDAAIADASHGTYGINMNGGKSVANYHDTAGSNGSSVVAMLFDNTYGNFGIQDLSTVGTFFYVHGTHTYAGIFDDTSAVAYRSGGTHSAAFLLDQSTTPTGLQLAGTYSLKQILGIGWSVDPSGNITGLGGNYTNTKVSTSATCDPGAWTGPVQAGIPPSGQPTPTCTGVFSAATTNGTVQSAAVVGIGLATVSTNGDGTGNGVSGDKTHDQYDNLLVQTVTQQDYTRQENAIHANMIINTGRAPAGFTTTNGDYREKTDIYATVRMEGLQAGPGWVFNPDLTILEGVGAQGGFNTEFDMVNFNMPYRAGGTLVFGVYRGFTGFPITNGDFWSGQAPSADGVTSPGLNISTVSGSSTISVNSASTCNPGGNKTCGVVSVDDMITAANLPNYCYVSSVNGISTATTYTYTGTASSGSTTLTVSTGVAANLIPGSSYIADSAGILPAKGVKVTAVSGNVLTLASPVGAAITTADTLSITVMPVNYRGNNVVLGCTASSTATELAGGQTFNMYTGQSFNGSQLIRDTTIADGTNSSTSYRVSGTHLTAFDTSAATLTYFGTMNGGQKLCFAGAGYCLAYNSANVTLQSNNNFEAPLVLTDLVYAHNTGAIGLGNAAYGAGFYVLNPGGNVANYLAIQPATAGFGPIFKALGSDTNIPLNFQAQGTGAVTSLSNFAVSATTASTSPTTGAFVVSGGMGVSGAAYHGGSIYVNLNGGAMPATASTPGLQIFSTVKAIQYLDTIGNYASLIIRRTDGTAAAPTALASGDQIGDVSFAGYDGTTYALSAAKMLATTTQAWTATAHGEKLDILTVPNGTTAGVIALTLNQDQSILYPGTTDSSSATTGNVINSGGEGIAKALNVGGIITGVGTTAATSVSTGEIVSKGGLGVAGAAYIGTTLNVAGASILSGKLTMSGTAPTLSGAGTAPTLNTGATDNEGKVTEGSVASGFTITFAAAYTNPPACVVSGSIAATAVTTSTTALTVTNSSNSGAVMTYVCMGK